MTAIDILRKLVSFDVFGGEPNLPLTNWIKSYLEQLGVEVHQGFNEEKTKAFLYARVGPAADGGMVLSGHLDVVPVEGQDWETNPFELIETADKFYARGSCDMKGFIACCLALIPEMQAASLKKPFYLAFSYDEEIGCMSGDAIAMAIKNHYPEDIPYALIGEPSMLRPTVGQKGICFLKTVVNGSAGHSSRILQEVSAIHESMRLINWLEKKMLDLVSKSRDDRFVPPQSSIHVGQIHAGIAPNVIADSCEFRWDIRTIPADDMQAILDEFDAFCRTREDELRSIFPAFQIETTKIHPIVPALDTPNDSPIVSLLRKIGNDAPLDAVSYAAEAGQFARNGYHAIICGPGSIAQAHRANEFIDKEQMKLGQDMLRALIKEFAS